MNKRDDEEEQPLVLGVDGSTGQYLPVPDLGEVTAGVGDSPLDPATLRERQWWVERHDVDEPDR